MTEKRKRDSRIQVTLAGQSDSGKTNLLSSLLGNDSSLADLSLGPDPVFNVELRPDAESGTQEDKDVDQLLSYSSNILRGRVLDNPGTDAVKYYPCMLSYSTATEEPQSRGLLARFSTAPTENRYEVPFKIVDGRGGDLAPPHYLDSNNPDDLESINRQTEYRLGLDQSVGLIVIMPMDEDGFDTDLANRLMQEVSKTISRRKTAKDLPPLKYISICFTKYDDRFTTRGALAGKRAAEKEEAVGLLYDTAMVKTFSPLFANMSNDEGYKICIFPVSTFGFLDGNGPANFYKYKVSPGLLSRAIDPSRDYDDPDMPGLKDHFPAPLSENDAKTMWRPFNIAPPLLFALTGRVTGPLALEPWELMPQQEEH